MTVWGQTNISQKSKDQRLNWLTVYKLVKTSPTFSSSNSKKLLTHWFGITNLMSYVIIYVQNKYFYFRYFKGPFMYFCTFLLLRREVFKWSKSAAFKLPKGQFKGKLGLKKNISSDSYNRGVSVYWMWPLGLKLCKALKLECVLSKSCYSLIS